MAEPTPTCDPGLGELVRRLVEAYRPERVYLFGSTARGDRTEDSDYDLVVIVPDTAPPAHRSSQLAYQVLRGTGLAADVLVWTSSASGQRVSLRASLPHTVVTEGRLLYAA